MLPVYLFGNPILRKKSYEIPMDYPNLNVLIDDMYETMYAAEGVGLAAPQVGLNIRLFVIDSHPFVESYPELFESIKLGYKEENGFNDIDRQQELVTQVLSRVLREELKNVPKKLENYIT